MDRIRHHKDVGVPEGVRRGPWGRWSNVGIEEMAVGDMIEIVPDVDNHDDYTSAINSLRSYVYRAGKDSGKKFSVTTNGSDTANVYRVE